MEHFRVFHFYCNKGDIYGIIKVYLASARYNIYIYPVGYEEREKHMNQMYRRRWNKKTISNFFNAMFIAVIAMSMSWNVARGENTISTAQSQMQITEESDTVDRIYFSFQYLMDQGFTAEAAAGVIGNMAVESYFDPSKVSGSGYHGLFQWNTSRDGDFWWYDIRAWIEEQGYEWNSFEGQLRAFLECPNKGLLSEERLEELKALDNVEQAVELVAVYYECCVGGKGGVTKYYQKGKRYQDLRIRKSEAEIAYQMYLTDAQEYEGKRPYSY